MKALAVGALLGAGLVLVCLSDQPEQALANGPSAQYGEAAHSSDLVTFSAPLPDGRQQLTVIDSRQRVMAIYHVDTAGEVALRCVRNFHWDLQMNEFNGVSPLPREIQSVLEQR